MDFRIEVIKEMKLVGKTLVMSILENKTSELWHSFMIERQLINNQVGSSLYSLQVYPDMYFESFNPNNEFQKYALIEVNDFNDNQSNMINFIIPKSMYAVFSYKGLNTDPSIFQNIYGIWLPKSDYLLDNRPHFEILGEKYKNNDPNSEEEIWIPIKNK